MSSIRPPQLDPDYELTYRIAAMPGDTNGAGEIFGGWLMSQVDIAGSILAIREARGRVATVAVKEFRFIAPVQVGDLVSCYCKVAWVGKTSVTVHCEVHVVHKPHDPQWQQVAESTVVYVALGDDGKPRRVKSQESA